MLKPEIDNQSLSERQDLLTSLLVLLSLAQAGDWSPLRAALAAPAATAPSRPLDDGPAPA